MQPHEFNKSTDYNESFEKIIAILTTAEPTGKKTFDEKAFRYFAWIGTILMIVLIIPFILKYLNMPVAAMCVALSWIIAVLFFLILALFSMLKSYWKSTKMPKEYQLIANSMRRNNIIIELMPFSVLELEWAISQLKIEQSNRLARLALILGNNAGLLITVAPILFGITQIRKNFEDLNLWVISIDAEPVGKIVLYSYLFVLLLYFAQFNMRNRLVSFAEWVSILEDTLKRKAVKK